MSLKDAIRLEASVKYATTKAELSDHLEAKLKSSPTELANLLDAGEEILMVSRTVRPTNPLPSPIEPQQPAPPPPQPEPLPPDSIFDRA